MKKIIAFAMSALLAVSAVALPVTAEPAVPFGNTELTGQARSVSAEELAEALRQLPEEAQPQQGLICSTVTSEAMSIAQVSAAEPLNVITEDRSPCSLTPAAPIVNSRHLRNIVLVKREGYEYRINNGEWQDSPGFYNLKEDTEYVLYQRIKETEDEYASEATQLRARTLAPVHNTSYQNFEKLFEYIIENGYEDDLGTSSIAYSVEIDKNNTYYFVISDWGTSIMCKVFNVSEDSSYFAFSTTFLINKHGKNMYAHSFIDFIHEGQLIEEVDASAPETLPQDYTDFCFDTISGSSAYLPDETLLDLFNSTVAMLAAFWDETIYQELGFGLKGLGFISYEGHGELYCAISAGYHTGTPVTIDYREPGCVIDGREGDQICSACGEILKTGAYIPAKGGHQYENGCDQECNVCGEHRRTQHIYSFDCDEDCDICGEVRTELLPPHSYINGICVCGHKNTLLGDATGDGKVNMGDASAVYAHVRGTTLLTDSVLLAMADVSGDGNINMGDISMIIAHVRGTKPLW